MVVVDDRSIYVVDEARDDETQQQHIVVVVVLTISSFHFKFLSFFCFKKQVVNKH